jgi:hypothetical protein
MENYTFRPSWISSSLSFVFIVLFLSAFSGRKDDFGKTDAPGAGNLREKIYLHIDRSCYHAGDDIWYKVYLVDANTHQPEAPSQIVYVDLIDPESKIVATKVIKMDQGCGTGDFKLLADCIKGEYEIRAYTNLMRNFDEAWFFRKMVFVNTDGSNEIANQDTTQKKLVDGKPSDEITDLKPDLQFFPEGGYMINGFINRVAFKAVGADGKGIDISGAIVDGSGEELANFKTLKFGLGELNFAPQKDQSYKANMVYNGTVYSYNLPASLDSGVVMQIIEKPDFYSIVIRSLLSNGVKDFELIGRQRNKLVSSSKIVGTLSGAKISIPKDVLEEGIAQFTLSDNNGIPLCERLVFVETNDAKPVVDVSPSKNEYGKRELVELEISSASARLNANMSISVADILDSGTDDYGSGIKSYLLLNSELRGEIEHPGYYFYSDDPQRKKVLDLLMMTQGWRQFILNDTLNNSSDLEFPLETGIRFDGQVRRFNMEGKPAKAEVSLIYSNRKEEVYNEITTDDRGHFVFDGFDFIDTTSVIIQAKKGKEGKNEDIRDPNKNFYIVMDSLTAPKVTHHKTSTNSFDKNPNFPSRTNVLAEVEADNTFQTQKGDILIEEVTITEKKKDRFHEKRSMYFEPSHSVDFNEIRRFEQPQNLLIALSDKISSRIDFQSLINVLKYGNDVPPEKLPLCLLDGMPVSLESLVAMPVSDIDFVDVLEGTKTTIYGPGGSHGVIAVYTLDGSDVFKNSKQKDEKCILNFVHPGYSKARKFYEPVYTSGNRDTERPDYRSTIYWNPSVKFDGQDKIRVSFYSADLNAKYKVILEGITSAGEAIHSENFLEVK